MAYVARPFNTGIALAVTVGMFYALCALLWALLAGTFFAWLRNRLADGPTPVFRRTE